jgi:hypothetical protein
MKGRHALKASKYCTVVKNGRDVEEQSLGGLESMGQRIVFCHGLGRAACQLPKLKSKVISFSRDSVSSTLASAA